MLQNSSIDDLITEWLNDFYLNLGRRCAWSALIDDDNTFESVVGTATYSLPSSFNQELFVANIAQGRIITKMTEGEWWQMRATAHNADTITNGTSTRYVILKEASQIKLDPPPDVAETYALPYVKSITDLSGDGDTTTIVDIEQAMEFYATGQGWAYQRNPQMADWYLQRAEHAALKRIKEERGGVNRVIQRISRDYNIAGDAKSLRFTGDLSYDTV